MKTRLGFFVGAGLGYYLGAKAGRQRYEQLNRFINNAKNSKTADVAEDKLRAVADVAAERAKETAGVAKEAAKEKAGQAKDNVNQKLHKNGSADTQTGPVS